MGGWLLEGTQLVIPAVSLAVASAECAGALPRLDYLIRGDPELVLVVPLIRASAVDVGGRVSDGLCKEILRR